MARHLRSLLLALALFVAPTVSAGVAPGDGAQPLTVETWHNTEVALSLDELAGEVVLLDFWGVWCGPCREAVPKLEALQRQFADRRFRIVSIHTPMGADQIEAFIAEHNMTVTIGVDTASSPTRKGPYGVTSDAYDVSSFPTYVLIDTESRIHAILDHVPEPNVVEALLPAAEDGAGAAQNDGPSADAVAPATTTSRPLLLTVDDLPLSRRNHIDPKTRERITKDLLKILARHQIRAVGFVIWGSVQDKHDRHLLDLWLEAGHELGNHSNSHRSYTDTDAATYIEDIETARRGLSEFLAARDRSTRFFRFPMLREGNTPAKLEAMRDYLRQSNQQNLPVTIDDQDWSFEEPWVTAVQAGDDEQQRVVGKAFQEALHLAVVHHERTGDRLAERRLPQTLLLHATQVGTAQWDELFTWLVATGHRFATADEVLADPIFETPPEYVATHGPGLWDRLLSERREATARREVRDLLAAQAAAWSRGDIESFCSVYADDAVFVSTSGITHGREAVLARYKRRYPDRQAMGRLTLDVVEMRLARGTEVSMMGDARPSRVHAASVTARWHLARNGLDDASGLTLIVLNPGPEGWRIVQDASM